MTSLDVSLWSRFRTRVRESSWAIDANDGIISTAGVLLGFAGAGAGDRLLLFTASATLLAGGLSAGGAKWAEVAAERETQLEMAQHEADQVARDPDGELAALASHWRERGLDATTAQAVAEQLMAHDPVAAQLDADYGVEEIMSRSAPWWAGVEAALAFMIGAAVPLLITYFAPVAIESWVILIAVVVSLTLTSLVAAGLGRLSALRMLRRSLIVGLGTMTVSYLAGLAFF